ncbi:hypothetical protein PsalMR5_03479 [Piscirickettsia salmonis]|uniref:hypothetical protein n=1 Tax=Piscirickettsia salmonis TaxID=1238 RepID=UPI001E2CF872|nr:hypothetical protein [Piscirickettsia salmonis]QGP56002.1 hypothetical protein PsalSR1_03472 [Piscirickettsia salmonis]QGP58129.1 hypothetical protein PsalBI1_00683 [Piscirickettsia salmonis]QGP65573.1 hypothetical protein PsalMR5_03479 [Piscirickettsia salmonis]
MDLARLYPSRPRSGPILDEISDAKIAKIEHTLNARRRASLDYRAPNHVFLENLMAA